MIAAISDDGLGRYLEPRTSDGLEYTARRQGRTAVARGTRSQKSLSERRKIVFQEVHAVTGGHRSGSLKGTVVTWDDSASWRRGRQDEVASEETGRVQKQENA